MTGDNKFDTLFELEWTILVNRKRGEEETSIFIRHIYIHIFIEFIQIVHVHGNKNISIFMLLNFIICSVCIRTFTEVCV